jgi:hypothetical protein
VWGPVPYGRDVRVAARVIPARHGAAWRSITRSGRGTRQRGAALAPGDSARSPGGAPYRTSCRQTAIWPPCRSPATIGSAAGCCATTHGMPPAERSSTVRRRAKGSLTAQSALHLCTSRAIVEIRPPLPWWRPARVPRPAPARPLQRDDWNTAARDAPAGDPGDAAATPAIGAPRPRRTRCCGSGHMRPHAGQPRRDPPAADTWGRTRVSRGATQRVLLPTSPPAPESRLVQCPPAASGRRRAAGPGPVRTAPAPIPPAGGPA